MNESLGWHTEDELIFVTGLGRRSCIGHDMSRADLLRNYLAAINKRKDWRGIDVQRVAAAARAQLEFEIAPAARIG